MKWKDNVIVKKKNKIYTLTLNNAERLLRLEHVYILEAIQKGLVDDKELVKYIMEKEEISEAEAGFTLADFLIEYADYVAEDHSHYEIT